MKLDTNITLVNHPLAAHNLAIIRSQETPRELFLNAFNRLSLILLAEGFKKLPLQESKIKTPVGSCYAEQLDESYEIILAPILRAGLALCQSAMKLLPQARIFHIGMYRDETTHKPVWYYDKTPADFKNHRVKIFILDPMLATGNSALNAVELFIKKGVPVQDITFISVLSAPEGVQLLKKAYPTLQIVTGALDEKLNEKAYIVPGLGDAGDRFFNT